MTKIKGNHLIPTQAEIEAAADELRRVKTEGCNPTSNYSAERALIAAAALAPESGMREPSEYTNIIKRLSAHLRDARRQLNELCEEVDGEGFNDPAMNDALQAASEIISRPAIDAMRPPPMDGSSFRSSSALFAVATALPQTRMS